MKTASRFILLAWMLVVGIWLSHLPVHAQAEEQWLAVRYAVCPEGITSEEAACERRIAHDLSVDVRNSTLGESIADGVVPGDDGYVWIDVSGMTPATIRVSADIPLGNIGVACSVDGEEIPASLTPGAHALAKFDVEAPDTGNVACTFYLYGTSGDAEYYGIIESPAPADEGVDRSAEVVALPNTGAGRSHEGRMGDTAIWLIVPALLAAVGAARLRLARCR